MKKRFLKKIMSCAAVLLAVVSLGTVRADAYVGQTLQEPEAGWNRYDDRETSKISYHMESIDDFKLWALNDNMNGYYKGTNTYATADGLSMQFVVNGSAFKIIGGLFNNTVSYGEKNAEVYVDGKLAGDVSQLSKDDEGGNKVIFDYKFDEAGQHIVKFVITSMEHMGLYNCPVLCYFNIDAVDTDGELLSLTPLFRYVNAETNQHFYTTDYTELGGGSYGYSLENNGLPQGCVFKNHEEKTVPLYRYVNRKTSAHFYTTDYSELGDGNAQYLYEGVQCYVYNSEVPGSVRLYRYYNLRTEDHFYTTDYSELGEGRDGYRLESMKSYILAY